jgi:carbon monoxide dehydrogenase subunit G
VKQGAKHANDRAIQMIETEQTILIDVAIDRVWDYVQDISKWAKVFPGCRECEVMDAHNSRWLIKVGAGGLVRTVKALVHVDQWDGPQRVNFSYKLEGDPVEGSGSYVATRKTANQTEVTLKVRVDGKGPMAPMWEAMSRPLLPQLAKLFAGQLKAEIEQATPAVASPAEVERVETVAESPSVFAAINQWLRNIWQRISGSQL